jgi:hypothetical protein
MMSQGSFVSCQRFGIGDKDVGAQPVEFLSADASHLSQVVHGTEWPLLAAMFDHPLRQLRADAG